MTRKLLPFAILICSFAVQAQTGYEIQVTLKPFKGQYIYLGHYFGSTYPIIDSVKLDAQSKGVFKGSNKLPGGIYLIGYPNKTGFFELLVDKQQHFGIVADTSTIAQAVQFTNSPDNVAFLQYQQTMRELSLRIRDLQQQLKLSVLPADSIRLRKEMAVVDQSAFAYRESIIKNQGNTLLGALMQCMRDPVLPENLKQPANAADSLAAYRFYKDHYWDGTNFWDGRLAYTTFFEEKLDRYFKQLLPPNPDSVIREIDNMMSFAQVDPEMNRFLLIKFINRYLTQQFMWEDAVFVHLYEKFVSNKSYPWLNEKGKKMVQDRAYSLMANILGNPAAEIDLPDSTGTIRPMYGLKTAFTLVIFWDPTCGHCKETLPRIDSLYRAKWSKQPVSLYAVAKETDGNRKNWLDFIQQNQLTGWTHVYYSKDMERQRTENGIPGYTQLFDIQTFPTLYLLDRDKRIVAKKLNFEQMDEIMDIRRAEKK